MRVYRTLYYQNRTQKYFSVQEQCIPSFLRSCQKLTRYGRKELKQWLELFSSSTSGSNEGATLHTLSICYRAPNSSTDFNESTFFLTNY